MIISHVKIIAFQLSLFCQNYRFSKIVLYIINRKIHGCLEIPDLFLVLNMISHSFAALTRESIMFNTRNKSGISAHPCIILYIYSSLTRLIDLSPYNQNFDLGKSRQIFHHSLKEHHKISNIPKFRCEML